MRAFASDNYAGAHPDVLAAMAEAGRDHAVSYGADPWTGRAEGLLREQFGPAAEPYLVFNGTAANVLALGSMLRPWEAVVTPAVSHLHNDEAGAPEHQLGVKLVTVPTPDGKLRPDDLEPLVHRRGDEHAVQPRVVSVANSTEVGTVYSAAELADLAEAAHGLDLLLHVDGARLANAAAACGARTLGEVTTAVGVDATSFGATKLGAIGAEAVVLLRPGLADGFAWRRKQHLQLASKMRYLAAQVVALLTDDLWLRLARTANARAAELAAAVRTVPGVRLTQEPQANGVFAVLPREMAEAARRAYPFYTWDPAVGEVRWMCSWDTRAEDVDGLVRALGRAARESA